MEEKEIWEYTKDEWKIIQGYEPFIAFGSYSPSQWGQMSKRTRNQVEQKNKRQLDRNEQILIKHENAVLSAYFDGKTVPEKVLKEYRRIIKRVEEQIKIKEDINAEKVERYDKALNLSLKEFYQYWKEKKIEGSKGTRYGDDLERGSWDHVLRQDARRYWKVVHGKPNKAPQYVQRQVAEDKGYWKQFIVVELERR